MLDSFIATEQVLNLDSRITAVQVLIQGSYIATVEVLNLNSFIATVQVLIVHSCIARGLAALLISSGDSGDNRRWSPLIMLDNQLPEKSCFISSHVLSPPPWGLVLDGRGYQAKTKMAGDRNNRQKWYSFVIAELKSTGNVGNNEISVILA